MRKKGSIRESVVVAWRLSFRLFQSYWNWSISNSNVSQIMSASMAFTTSFAISFNRCRVPLQSVSFQNEKKKKRNNRFFECGIIYNDYTNVSFKASTNNSRFEAIFWMKFDISMKLSVCVEWMKLYNSWEMFKFYE